MTKLKGEMMPCPFCGGGVEIVIDESGSFSISCIHCEYSSPSYNEREYAQEAHNNIAEKIAKYETLTKLLNKTIGALELCVVALDRVYEQECTDFGTGNTYYYAQNIINEVKEKQNDLCKVDHNESSGRD